MTGAHAAQRHPRPGEPEAGFPAEQFPRGVLYRAHRRTLGAWFFSNSEEGRFNLAGSNGTCYLADDIETAMREHLREAVIDTQAVTEARAVESVVTRITADLPGPMGNVTHRLAQRHGILRELCTTVDYLLTRAWARAFHREGFAGIRYASRFTSGPGPNAWARFGDAGRATSLARTEGARIDGPSACNVAGIAVLVPPFSSSGLTIRRPSSP